MGELNQKYLNFSQDWIILGDKYRFGLNVPQSDTQAFKCYQHAAFQGNGYAELMMGYCYDFGIGTEQSFEKAFDLYQKALNEKVIEAYRHLSFAYFRMEGELAYKKANDLCAKYYSYRTSQSDYGNLNASLILGCQQLLGDYFFLTAQHIISIDQAFEYFERLAEKNDWLGLELLGISYTKYRSVKDSKEKALHYLTLAINQPDVDEGCLYVAAKLLLMKEESNVSQQIAEQFLRRIVNNQSIPKNLLGKAAYLLGSYHETTSSLTQDITKP